ncbi:hypothetical protein NHQ30_008730 [Ciborinia camelliae]|nr:hypothetical protein NHQ30_008730 [Ciborinia camelliae]
MSKSTEKSEIEFEERVAHIVWAAHILSCLTNTKRHGGLQQEDTSVEEQDFDYSEVDADTERTVILQGSEDSIRSKFLDCLAQLLSPSKREWGSVTATALREREDFVEIDVARNDCFGLTTNCVSSDRGYLFGAVEAEYCESLRTYISTDSKHDSTALSEFECFAIAYTSQRVDYWVKELQNILSSASSRLNKNGQNGSWGQLGEKNWANFTRIISQDHLQTAVLRYRIVQKAYECVMGSEVHALLQKVFEATVVSKLWRALRFLARPLTDCRLLRDIASHHLQFQDIRVFPVSPVRQTSISLHYQIDISEAWAKLVTGSLLASDLKKLTKYHSQFKEDCAKAYYLHAEMQLIVYYENSRNIIPTFKYFGCSKKTCLLCERFLQSLPDPVGTRGGHVPISGSAGVGTALERLETILVSQIKAYLRAPDERRKTLFASNIAQSSIVSQLSDSTLEDLKRREENIKSLKEAEIDQREGKAILEGLRLDTKSSNRPNFEPHDSCVMCNKSPAQSDWPSHKLLCKKFSVQKDRPSMQHKRAILFPEKSANPQMIWILCETKYDEGSPYEIINLNNHLGADRPFTRTTRIEHNPVRDRNLGSGMAVFYPRKEGYSIALYYREDVLHDGSVLNRSILESVGKSGTVGYSWSGPIVAVRETATEFHEDITLGDFRHMIDWLINYRTTNLPDSVDRPENTISTAVRGVKICCYGEIKLHGSEPYVAVDVPRGHSAHPGSIKDLGNVLATRVDGKDLAVDDVRMMCEFTRRKLQPMFEDSMGAGLVSRTKQEVLDYITWENMIKFNDETAEETEDL